MKPIIYILALSLLWSCSAKKEAGNSTSESTVSIQRQAPQLIYKTKKDYSQNVPVQMNSERTKIVGFPAPSDILINGELQTPIELDQGYYYDRRGISYNSVFLKIPYEEYSKLKKAPAVNELMKLIIDKDPFVEIYNCPDLKQNASVEEINSLVNSGFKGCLKFKLN